MDGKINLINLLCDQSALSTAMEAVALCVLQPDMMAVLRFSLLRPPFSVGGAKLQNDLKKISFPNQK